MEPALGPRKHPTAKRAGQGPTRPWKGLLHASPVETRHLILILEQNARVTLATLEAQMASSFGFFREIRPFQSGGQMQMARPCFESIFDAPDPVTPLVALVMALVLCYVAKTNRSIGETSPLHQCPSKLIFRPTQADFIFLCYQILIQESRPSSMQHAHCTDHCKLTVACLSCRAYKSSQARPARV